MKPAFICFFCCLIVAAFLARTIVVALVRAVRKDGARPAFFPKGWAVVSGLALVIVAVQMGVAVHEMRSLYRVGELVQVGDSKAHVATLVKPAWTAVRPQEERPEEDHDVAETWWVVVYHGAISPIPGKSAWQIGFDDNDRVCFSGRSLAY